MKRIGCGRFNDPANRLTSCANQRLLYHGLSRGLEVQGRIYLVDVVFPDIDYKRDTHPRYTQLR